VFLFFLRFFYKKPELLKEQANVYDLKIPEKKTDAEEQPRHLPMRLGRCQVFRIHRILVFFGLLDPDLDPLVRGMDPDPYIIMQK
jgi:hypothetical protein